MKIHHNIKILALLILIVLFATGIDWMTHRLIPSYVVSSDYFNGEIFHAAFWGWLGILALAKEKNPVRKAAWLSFMIAVILQTRYYLQGYDMTFVILFGFIHFVAFLIPTIVVFSNFPELFGEHQHQAGRMNGRRRHDHEY